MVDHVNILCGNQYNVEHEVYFVKRSRSKKSFRYSSLLDWCRQDIQSVKGSETDYIGFKKVGCIQKRDVRDSPFNECEEVAPRPRLIVCYADYTGSGKFGSYYEMNYQKAIYEKETTVMSIDNGQRVRSMVSQSGW